uniref:Ribonuclease H-like domain-containing protein n=1 Tax=Tanacetum cinerariifolium TaxID=118510 RepID=A0A6L2L5E9_TANCI|nr:ribonuclease H-like domain-containing protein [Tanacetum cinerariifolium]
MSSDTKLTKDEECKLVDSAKYQGMIAKMRSDHGNKRTHDLNYRSSSTTLNHLSSSYPLDNIVDVNNEESFHSNSSSLSQNVSSSSNVVSRVVQNPPHESQHLNTYLFETINLQTQQQDDHRKGLRSIGKALKDMESKDPQVVSVPFEELCLRRHFSTHKNLFFVSMESLSPQVVSAAKLPILNPNEFDLWKMRIEQYFLMTDYSLSERLARKNELKARGTLLMALPDKHQLKFNTHKDAKTLMGAIEKSTNEPISAAASVSVVSEKIPVSALLNVDTLVRARRFLQRTRRNLRANGPTSIGFDMSKVECYNSHRKGHFSRECSYNLSFQADEKPTNYALMAFTSLSSSFDNEPDNDLSHTHRPSVPIIEDWVSDSEVESKTKIPQNVPSFSQPIEPIKSPRPSVQHVETFTPTANPKTAISKPTCNGHRKNRKACFVCQSLDHLIKDCDYHEKKMDQTPLRNHALRGYNKHYARMSLPNLQRHVVPTAVLTKSKLVHINDVRPVTAVVPKPTVTRPRQAKTVVTKPTSPPRRHINHSSSPKASNFPLKVTDVKVPQVNASKGVQGKWEWKTKCTILDHVSRNASASMTLKRFDYNDALGRSKSLMAWGVIDSGCSRHMTGNMSYLSDFEELNGGYVAFGSNPKGGKISSKGKIRTGKLDFDDVYFIKELKFNLFSISHMCDKKNSVPFTDTECLVLSPEFKLPDENQVLLRVFRENNMYNVNLKNIVPSEDLTCLSAKTTLDEMKGIKREFSVPRTPQQNGIAKRKNRTLIEAARTMLADSLLPIPFWAEAVNTTCYVQNKVLVTKPHNKTLYELLHDRTPSIGLMRPFGCPVTILDTLDSLGKFDRKVDEGFLVGYSVSSKAFRVFNSRTRIVQETLHINFLENMPNVVGSGPTWLFYIDTLKKTMTYQPVTAGNQSNPSVVVQEQFDAEKAREEIVQQYVLFHVWSSGSTNPQNTDGDAAFNEKKPEFKGRKPESEVMFLQVVVLCQRSMMTRPREKLKVRVLSCVGKISTNNTNTFSVAGPSNADVSPTEGKSSYVDSSQLPNDPNMPELEDITFSDIKMMLGNDYEEVFALVARIEAIRLFLAYASFMGFMVHQMDVKSAFLYGTIEEEQCKKQTVVATSSTKAEYAVAASCCAQVLWIQNQLLDYRKDDDQSGRTVTITTEDIQRKKHDVKARTTLLLYLPDEHQLRFSKYKTGKELWAAILKTFGGNEATKKRKKNLLK